MNLKIRALLRAWVELLKVLSVFMVAMFLLRFIDDFTDYGNVTKVGATVAMILYFFWSFYDQAREMQAKAQQEASMKIRALVPSEERTALAALFSARTSVEYLQALERAKHLVGSEGELL